MKTIVLIFLFSMITNAQTLTVQIESNECRSDVVGQVFVASTKDLTKLVYQIEVPLKSKISLNLPKEQYKITFVSKSGCEDVAVVDIAKTPSLKLNPRKKL